MTQSPSPHRGTIRTSGPSSVPQDSTAVTCAHRVRDVTCDAQGFALPVLVTCDAQSPGALPVEQSPRSYGTTWDVLG